MILSYKYRVKDATAGKHLDRHAQAVNYVWNYCCQIQREAERKRRAGLSTRWPTSFDLIKLCTGSSVELGVHSDTVQTVCRQFASSRDVRKRCPRFRASRGPKRALGWVPFVARNVKLDGPRVVYLKRKFHFWKSREVDGTMKAGSFIQDARGRWYVSFQCEVATDRPTGNGQIGIDLGIKALATCSDGTVIGARRYYGKYEEQLSIARRARNKRRAQAIHAKITNSRRHYLHEWSSRIARENALIVVGDVSAGPLVKTDMAKSVLDMAWSMLRAQLAYKARRHNAEYVEADERWTSRTCSCCGIIPDSSPKGRGMLRVRHWVCSGCGASHDRDVNAARNILRVGLERQPLAGEIPPAARLGEDVTGVFGCDGAWGVGDAAHGMVPLSPARR